MTYLIIVAAMSGLFASGLTQVAKVNMTSLQACSAAAMTIAAASPKELGVLCIEKEDGKTYTYRGEIK